MDPPQTRFFHLLSMRTKMVGPSTSDIVLYLATVALADRASVLVASDTGAITVSPPGGVALVRPVQFSVVALDSEEPIEDILFPNVGSTSDVSSDMAFSFHERMAASTTRSKMVRVTAGGAKVAVPSGQSDRVPVLAPESIVPVDPTADWANGSEVSVRGRLTGHGPDRVCGSSLRTRQCEGAQYATREIRENAKYDRKFALGYRRNTSSRAIRNHSVAEETIGAHDVRSQARRTNDKAREGVRLKLIRGLHHSLPSCACSCTQTPPFTKPMSTLMKKDQTMRSGRRQSRRVLGCDRTFLQGRLVFFGPFVSWRTDLSA